MVVDDLETYELDEVDEVEDPLSIDEMVQFEVYLLVELQFEIHELVVTETTIVVEVLEVDEVVVIYDETEHRLGQ